MSGAFTVTVNDRKARAKLDTLKGAAGNMQPVFATIGRVLTNRIRLCFKLGIDPWGSPWAALRFRRGQPLRDTGRLQRSVSSRPDATGVTVGTNLIYAPTHQFGAVIRPRTAPRLVFPGPGGRLIFAKKVTIPARPFMPLRKDGSLALPPAWSVDVTRALRTYFINAAKKV
jgi:phage virion morphogenesis protein